jgi:hypothetical protein
MNVHATVCQQLRYKPAAANGALSKRKVRYGNLHKNSDLPRNNSIIPRYSNPSSATSINLDCWSQNVVLEKISWTDHMGNEEVLLRVKQQRNILHEISKRKANWIGHILRRNCLLQQVIEGKIKGMIEVTGRRGRRRRKLLVGVIR